MITVSKTLPRLPLTDVTAVIIAGGESRRFGSPKALALLNGRPLLDHALQTARGIAAKILLSCNDVNVYSRYELPVVRDVHDNLGPLAGIVAALHAAETRWIAVIPCDMPLLPVVVYKILAKAMPREKPVAARSATGVEPLVSLWPKTALDDPAMQTAIATRQSALHRLLAVMDAVTPVIPVELPKAPQWIFQNVNTPADLQAIQRRISK